MTENHNDKLLSNIDAAEIARFEAMAPIWWDKRGDFKALHDINALRLNYISDRISLAGKAVLDAGCGTGLCAPLLRPHATHLTGCDISVPMLEKAKAKLGYDALLRSDLGAPVTLPPGGDHRTPLPADAPFGTEVAWSAALLTAPELPGSYTLRWDMVHEGISWFADQGSPVLELPVEDYGKPQMVGTNGFP